ncbi:major facilitator superfamily MFS_1 [Serinicoccus hydrothermalis]|uniref:Major facilitator superfamily MFS_1 n=1 Tax=Serinicoccus hydrothermalis TaxID=1758689 RepID=A0A1B1NDI4_9MICO|nr:major facilitator superfamily MFS_1 [Serinicoccus hydrothermalis]
MAVLFQVWEMTRNPFAVAAIGVAQAVPMIVFGLVGGPVADVLDRRRVALAATAGQSLAATALAAQLVVGSYPLPLLLAVLSLQTACSALGAPARRTFIVRLLPRVLVPAGIALHMISFQVAMMVGPALGGLVLGVASPAVCYLVNAVALALSAWTVWALPAMPPERSAPAGPAPSGPAPSVRPEPAASAAVATAYPRARGARLRRRMGTALTLLAEGVAQVRRDPVLRGSFLLDLAATLLAFPVALFPMVNETLFDGDPRTLGLFLTCVAIGGVTAGLGSGLVTRRRRLGVVQLLAVGVWGVALLGFGLASLTGLAWAALAALVVAGAADTVSVTSRAAMVQLATPDSHLGRVSAVEHVIGVAGPDVGNARAGLVAGLTTPAWSALLGSLACLGAAAWVALTHRQVAEFRVAD